MKCLRVSAVIVLCITLLFSTVACGPTEKSEGKKAMGRYLESRLDLPMKDKGIMTMLQRPDGSFDVYYALDDQGRKFTRYNTKDGENWKEEAVSWVVPENQFISKIVYDKEGHTYVMSMTFDDSSVSAHVYRVDDNGTMNEIDMQWKDETGGVPKSVMSEGLTVADNGDLFVGQSSTSVGQYAMDGSFKRLHSGGASGISYSGFFTSGSELYVIDSGDGTVLCYSVEDGSLIRTIPFDSFTDNTQITKGAGGVIYLQNKNGIFHLAAGGSMWEKLVDGELTSLTIPSIYYSDLIEGMDGALYLYGGNEKESNLYKYVYDEKMATLPEKELVVYSLHESAMLRQAAGEFQRSHPDTRVNIQVAMGEDSAATKSDLIRALNTELLNGKGPDILLLDGMPVDSYIEKGVFADLSDLLGDMDADKTMNKTVISTYQNKDGIFAVPTKFNVPVLITNRDYAGEMKDLESMAAFATAHPDKPLLGNKSPSSLMEVFFASCAPAWIKGGEIDEAGLQKFLENMKDISGTAAKSYELEENADGTKAVKMGASVGSQNKGSSEDIYHWAFGRAHSFTKNLTGSIALMDPALAMRKMPKGVVTHLPGQVEGVYVPMGILGVNEKSKMADSAKDFIKLMLSEELQETTGNIGGFPVNLAALDAIISQVQDDMYIGGNGTYNKSEELAGEMPTPEEKKPIRELCNTVKTPYKADETLAEMIINEAQGYFTGEKDIAKTISDIKEATKLYLSE